MSDEQPILTSEGQPAVAVEPVALPETVRKTVILTWTRPPIVTRVDGDVLSLKQGLTVQTERRTETTFGYEVVAEEPVFRVVATQKITFGGVALSVLNAGSMPTGADYLARLGTEVPVGFRCEEVKNLREVHGRAVYATYRAWMTLP